MLLSVYYNAQVNIAGYQVSVSDTSEWICR